MSAIVALKLLLEGQKETASGISDVSKQTSALGVAADKAGLGVTKLSGGLEDLAKQGVGAASSVAKSSDVVVLAEKKVADALRTSALAAKQAGDAKVRAANLASDAVAKQAAGDLKGAEASRIAAQAATDQAAAYTKMSAAMRSQTTAARANLASVKASTRSGATGGLFGAAARGGGLLVKAGAATGAFLGYEGVKRAAGIETQALQLHTLANVPMSQIAGLQKWAISNSVGLRATPAQLLQEMYRIASSSPGKPYSAATLKKLDAASQRFTLVGGSTVDPDQAARVFGIIRANGGLGVGNNYNKIGAISRSIIGSGDMTAGDLVSAIGTGGLAVNAARHKISYTALGGMLAEMGDLGVNGSRAGNALQHAISLMSSPSKQASEIYTGLGLAPTAIDQIIRSKGLLAGMAVLQKALARNSATAMPGMTANASDFTALGFGRKQAASMAAQGPQALQDLLLTRMFGGAKQSIPIIALLNGLQRTGSKTSEIAQGANITSYLQDVTAAATTPTNTFKRFDLDLQQLETNIGLKLIPKLEGMADWISRNETAVEGIGRALEIIAIPATAAWITSLATKGVTGLGNFSRGLQGTSGGLGIMQKGVLGLTTAIGAYALGSTTKSGGGGLAEATLGGAIAGMTAGLATGSPLGVAIFGIGGAVAGLAGHFHLLTGATNASDKAMQAWMTTAYEADRFKIGAQFKSQLLQYLSKQSVGVTGALADAGITAGQILGDLKGGVPGSGPAYNQLISAYNSGKISQAEYTIGSQALSSLDTNFLSQVQVWNNLATIEGKTTQTEQIAAQNLQTLLAQTASGTAGIAPKNGDLSSLLSGALGRPVHIHLHLDGREITNSVKAHLLNDAADAGTN